MLPATPTAAPSLDARPEDLWGRGYVVLYAGDDTAAPEDAVDDIAGALGGLTDFTLSIEAAETTGRRPLAEQRIAALTAALAGTAEVEFAINALPAGEEPWVRVRVLPRGK